jgi:hypothetical protein
MDVLPRFIEVLGADGRPLEPRCRLKRAEPGGRSEAEWDRILTENVELLADALSQAEVVEEDSSLLYLGRQIDGIDLLFAEVRAHDRELRRLVLVEDKLLRNPEARREVLAQILDYARRVQEDWPGADLAAKLRGHEAWVQANEDELRQGCRRGDFLLVVAGDGIDDRLMKLARRFAGKDDPLSLTELALVSMALYQQGNQLLLVPHVVSAVLRSEREMTVRVVVQDVHGHEVPADVVRDVQEEAAQASRHRQTVREEVAAFFRKARAQVEAELLPAYPSVKTTAKPRKYLEYALPLAGEATAIFKIHFGGGHAKDAWAPIQVGLMLIARDTPTRDAWRRRIEAVANLLPAGVRPEIGGPLTINVLTSFEWSTGEDLNDALVSKVTQTLLQCISVLLPILSPP